MIWWPRLGVLHRDRMLTYLMVACLAVLFVGCGMAAGHLQIAGGLVVVAGLVAVLIDGSAGAAAVLLGALTFDWLISVRDAGTWWTLPAAGLLIMIWSASTLAGSGPHEARLSPPLVRAWATRTALVVGGVLAVAAAALSLMGVGQVGTPLIAATAFIAIATALVTLSVRRFGTR